MSRPSKIPPPDLKALGRRGFPERIAVAGRTYDLLRVYKHDFFAATGLMESSDGRRVVLKIGRMAPILGLPAAWMGAFLAGREARVYQALHDLDGIPAWVGMWGRCGLVHEWAPGHPLDQDEPVRDDFFSDLEGLLKAIHRRGIAYVDLEKSSNILVGEDGRPCLIDFQISWHWPGVWGTRFPLAWARRKLQQMDLYHLLKHRRRTRPDQLDSHQLQAAQGVPGYIRLHRRITAPLQRVRRGFLRRVDPDHASAPR